MVQSPDLLLSPDYSLIVNDLLSRVNDATKFRIVPSVKILLPTRGAIQDLQTRLGSSLGVEWLQFHELTHLILEEDIHSHRELSGMIQKKLIHHILAELDHLGKLTTFNPLAAKPGFIDVLQDWLREMQSQDVSPEQVAAFAERWEGSRDRQLALVYREYHQLLNTHLLGDADGLQRRAARILQNGGGKSFVGKDIFVLGFDQFTPVQLDIIQALASRSRSLTMYLAWDAQRDPNSLALNRLKKTRSMLEEKLDLNEVVLPLQNSFPAILDHLNRNLFEVNPDPPMPADQQVVFMEAPSREQEARWVLRECKRELLKGGRTREIAVTTPNPEMYDAMIRTVAEEYGIPVNLKINLIQTPLVRILSKILDCIPDFPRVQVLDVLRSPLIHQTWLTAQQVDWLDELSRERPVMAGRKQWEYALSPAETGGEDWDDEDFMPRLLAAELPEGQLAALRTGLAAFFDYLNPPERAQNGEFAAWICGHLLGMTRNVEGGLVVDTENSLKILERCQERDERDQTQASAEAIWGIGRNFQQADEILPDSGPVSWKSFRRDWSRAVNEKRISLPNTNQGIRFTDIADVRARPVDHLFILGLSEGEFPTTQAPDLFYTPAERQSIPLNLYQPDPADQASLWWQVVSSARKRLVFSRPYLDERGAPWDGSAYWDEVLSLIEDPAVERLPIAMTPAVEQAASRAELLVALAREQAGNVPESLEKTWQHIRETERVMRTRESNFPPGSHEGKIEDPDILDDLALKYGADHVWSASRLNRYAYCPFVFFAENVLELDALEELEEGMDALQRGSMLHAILEDFNREMAEKSLRYEQNQLAILLEMLKKHCRRIFARAPRRYGFRPGPLWEYEKREMRRMLEVLAAWECGENGPGARYAPYRLEAAFGFRGQTPLEVKDELIDFKLRGLIDRLDRDNEGFLRVIDYKSGRMGFSKQDMEKGIALQTALYALAADCMWGDGAGKVLESYYLHIPNQQKSGRLTFEGPVREDSQAAKIIHQAAFSVNQIREGIFPSAPAKSFRGEWSCQRYCDFRAMCRVSRQSVLKAKKAGMV